MTIYFVENTKQLKAAFERSANGDTIKLAGGDYDWIKLQNRSFDESITITYQDPDDRPNFKSEVLISNVDGLIFEGVDIKSGAIARSDYTKKLSITNSSNITFRDVEMVGHLPTADEGTDPLLNPGRHDAIAGLGYENGVSIRWSENINFQDVEMSNYFVAIKLQEVKNVNFNNIDVHDVREGVNLVGFKNVTIQNSEFYDIQDYHKDHTDMIQYWGHSTNTSNDGLYILNNRFVQPEGLAATQTIFGHMANARDGVTSSNFVITGNTIINGHPHGISLGDVEGGLISNNLLIPHEDVGWGWDPKITLMRSSDFDVTGNIVVGYSHIKNVIGANNQELETSGTTVDGNLMLSKNPSAPNFWGKILEQMGRDGFGHPQLSDAEVIMAIANGEQVDWTSVALGDEGIPNFNFFFPNPDENDGDDKADDLNEAAPQNPQNPATGDNTNSNDKIYVWHNKGTDTGDILRSGNTDTILDGGSGADRLYEGRGNDTMIGGDGADIFIFDYRINNGEEDHNIILDLNFAEGDKINMSSGIAGTFANVGGDGNYLLAFNEGKSAHFDSNDDIVEAIKSGSISYFEGEYGIVIFDLNKPFNTLEINGLTSEALGLPTTAGYEGVRYPYIPQADKPAFKLPEQIPIKVGTEGRDDLRGNGADTVLRGEGGNDRLYEGYGDTYMEGGAGADTFYFDFRADCRPGHTTISDLNFKEGDKINLSSSLRGEFYNRSGDGNHLLTFNDGKSAHFDSLEDIAESIELEQLMYYDGEYGIVLFNEFRDDQTLELVGITSSMLSLVTQVYDELV